MKMQGKLSIRLPNWVGDVIMALPAIDALANHGFQLTLYGKPWIHDLLSAYDFPMESISSDFWPARKVCCQSDSDIFLLMTNSISSAASVFFSGKKAIGYRTDVRRLFLNRSLPKQSGLHEVEYFYLLAQFATAEYFKLKWQGSLPQKLMLKLKADKYEQARQVLHQAGIDGEFWVICPGAVGLGAENQSKIWPYWRQLSLDLCQAGRTLIACPGPGEEAFFKQVLSPEVTILPGLSLSIYAALIAQASSVIANDSGPMHLAAASQTDVLGIFGVTDPRRTRPWDKKYLGGITGWPDYQSVLSVLISKF